MEIFDIIIIGAGPAGLTAAVYGARGGNSVLLLEKDFYGGQIVNTPDVENYPAISSITGFDFANTLYEQAIKFGAVYKNEEVVDAALSGKIKKVMTNKHTYEGRSVIIANGVKRRKLGCPGEETFSGRGVSYCATCDGAFYKGKRVAIVGGGNTALDDALFLANLCEKVYLIHRRDEFRGAAVTAAIVTEKENIEICFLSKIAAIQGDKAVSSIALEYLPTGDTREISVSGVFIAVGLEPNNGIFSPAVRLTQDGYFSSSEDCSTNIPGVFVAGDNRNKQLRQLITAEADGAIAATNAALYIKTNR